MTAVPPRVAAIILHYGRIEETVAAVASASASTVSVEVVLVNNGNPADVSKLRSGLDLIVPPANYQIIECDTNRGFAAGVNLGLRVALGDSPNYFFLLNNDASVEPETLAQLIAALESDPKLGIVSPLIYFAGWPERIWAVGWSWNRRVCTLRPVDLRAWPNQPAIVEVDVTAGCAMLLSRSTIEKIGFFDERYFMYYEDADYCLRAAERGVGVAVVTRARAYHRVGLKPRVIDPARVQTWARSKALFYTDRVGARSGWRAAPRLVLGATGYCSGRVLSCDLRSCMSYLRGTIDGWQAGARASL